MRSEYDFSRGVRGKHYKSRQDGYTVKIHMEDGTTLVRNVTREKGITLEPDVQRYFPNSQAVNRALRALITLFPKRGRAADSQAGRTQRERGAR